MQDAVACAVTSAKEVLSRAQLTSDLHRSKLHAARMRFFRYSKTVADIEKNAFHGRWPFHSMKDGALPSCKG